MKRLIYTLLMASVLIDTGISQAPPVPLKAVIYNNIRSTSTLDGCFASYPCIDNRSANNRRSSIHSFRAYGTGTWQVDMEWADTTPTGFVSYGSTAVVTQATPSSAIGYGIDPANASHPYHDYIRFNITGANASTVTIQSYFGTQNTWWLPAVGGISYPIAVNQGGTGLTSSIYYPAHGAASLATVCTAAATANQTVIVDEVMAVATGFTCAAPIIFLGNGQINPASGQAVTAYVQSWTGVYRICGTAGGTCNFYTVDGTVDPLMWGTPTNGSSDAAAGWTLTVAATGSWIVDGMGRSYALTSTEVLVANSNQVIRNARLVVNRSVDGPAFGDRYGFYISGDVNQVNVRFEKLSFTGTGYWGGIASLALYSNDAWDPSYPTVGTQRYTTKRKSFRFHDLNFTSSYYESIFLTNVQSDISDINVVGCETRHSVVDGVGCIISRFTEDSAFSKIRISSGWGKDVGSDNARNMTYSDISIRGAYNYELAIYVGHFNQDTTVTNVNFNGVLTQDHSVVTGDVGANFFKISYYAQRTTLSNSTFVGSGYGFVQAALGTKISNVNMYSSGARTFQASYGNQTANDVLPDELIVSGSTMAYCAAPVPVAGGGQACTAAADTYGLITSISPLTIVAPRTVEISSCTRCQFIGNTVYGNIYGNPVKNLTVAENKIYLSNAYPTPFQALLFQNYQDATIRGNRIETTFTTVPVVYLNGDGVGIGASTFSGNSFTQPASGYAVTASGHTTGTLDYFGNKPLGSIGGQTYEFINTVSTTNTSYAYPTLSGISSSLGGGALAAGACSTDTAVAVTGATTAMTAEATPTTNPGDPYYWKAYVSATNNVVVKVCAAVAGTPTASTYKVTVKQVTP